MKLLRLIVNFAACGFLVAKSTAVEIASWSQVEHELNSSIATNTFKEICHQSRIFKQLIAERNIAVFMEMVGQNNSPIVQMAGLYGLVEIAPEKSLEVAFRMALSPDISMHAIPLYSVLKEIPMDKGFDRALTLAFQTRPADISAATSLIQSLSSDRLWNWLQAKNHQHVLPTYEAVVVEQLLNNRASEKKIAPEQVREFLLKFRDIPGFPRSVYLVWTDETDAAYISTMKLALADESLPFPSLLGLVRIKASYIIQHIDLDSLRMPEDRKSKIASVLASVERIRK